VIIDHASLAATAVRGEQFPGEPRPEIAFAGKSNVGKSSLINAMLGRKALARSSRHPGKTRTINFYSVEVPHACAAEKPFTPDKPQGVSHGLYFVDLPGYGYAKVSRSESIKWGAMVEGYLSKRTALKLILLLLDIRHEPGAHDRQLYEWCVHYQLPLAIVATKSDKLKKSQIQKHVSLCKRGLNTDLEPLPFSSETKEGRDALWAIILDKCGLVMI
jgi:GTP-binding protein